MTTLIETNDRQNRLLFNSVDFLISQVAQNRVAMTQSEFEELLILKDMLSNLETDGSINSFVS